MPAGKRSKLHPWTEEQKKDDGDKPTRTPLLVLPSAGQNEPGMREKLSAKSPWKDLASHHEQHDVNSLVCMEGVEKLGGEKQHVLLGMEQSGLIANPKHLCMCPQRC